MEIGDDITASDGYNAIAIGNNSKALSTYSIAIGNGSVAGSTGASLSHDTIAIGNNSSAVSVGAMAIGNNSYASSRSISIGDNAQSLRMIGGIAYSSSDSVVIGSNSSVVPSSEPSGQIGGTSIGADSRVYYGSGVSVGYKAIANYNGIAIGNSAMAISTNAAQIGVGENSNESTLKFMNTVVVDCDTAIGEQYVRTSFSSGWLTGNMSDAQSYYIPDGSMLQIMSTAKGTDDDEASVGILTGYIRRSNTENYSNCLTGSWAHTISGGRTAYVNSARAFFKTGQSGDTLSVWYPESSTGLNVTLSFYYRILR